LASASVEAATPAAKRKRITLMLNEGEPARVNGDALRLGQMMDNLISNAIKFTPPGGSVTVTTGSANGNSTLDVRGTGAGISARDQQQVFERFFRSHAAHEETIPGTGLGLTITKAIVDAHSGTIDMQSMLGRGTTIKITLPRG